MIRTGVHPVIEHVSGGAMVALLEEKILRLEAKIAEMEGDRATIDALTAEIAELKSDSATKDGRLEALALTMTRETAKLCAALKNAKLAP